MDRTCEMTDECWTRQATQQRRVGNWIARTQKGRKWQALQELCDGLDKLYDDSNCILFQLNLGYRRFITTMFF